MIPIMKYISRTSRLAILYRNDAFESYGLNGHQHTYILNICQNPGISQDQLSKLIFVNKSNVARQLALLEKLGMIVRIPLESDRRQMQVFPTDKGKEIYPVVVSILHKWNETLLEDFTKEEKEMLVIMMQKVMNKAIQMIESPIQENGDPK